MDFDTIFGLLLAFVATISIGTLVLNRERNGQLRQVMLGGLLLRVGGSLLYFALIENVYGSGDYTRYLAQATEVFISRANPDVPNFSIVDHNGGRWWGTPSVSLFTFGVMTVFGTNPIPVFMAFGLVSFLAALCFVTAFRRAFPHIDPMTYTKWVMFFPSLWFWPSPVGKDGPVLLGIGLAFLGVVGLKSHRNYVLIALGVAVTFIVRPQYALVLMVVLLGGVLLGRRTAGGGGGGKAIAALVLIPGAIYLTALSSDALGFDVTEAEETSEWIDVRGEATAYGGSAFEAASNPATGAFNVLFRPFPWEASGILVLVSASEVVLLWLLLWRRRRSIKAFLRAYRGTEPVWLSALFVLILAGAVGMAVGNFGTLARQRIHIYPFLFLLAASLPAPRFKGRRVRRSPRGGVMVAAAR